MREKKSKILFLCGVFLLFFGTTLAVDLPENPDFKTSNEESAYNFTRITAKWAAGIGTDLRKIFTDVKSALGDYTKTTGLEEKYRKKINALSEVEITDPKLGEMYYNTAEKKIKVYREAGTNGEKSWQDVDSQKLAFDEAGQKLVISRGNDVSLAVFAKKTNLGKLPTTIPSPLEAGRTYYDDATSKKVKVYDGTTWKEVGMKEDLQTSVRDSATAEEKPVTEKAVRKELDKISFDFLVGKTFFSTTKKEKSGLLYAGKTYKWSENAKLKALFDAENHGFIEDKGDGTFTVTSHTDFIRAGAVNIGKSVGDTISETTTGVAPNHRNAYFGIYGDGILFGSGVASKGVVVGADTKISGGNTSYAFSFSVPKNSQLGKISMKLKDRRTLSEVREQTVVLTKDILEKGGSGWAFTASSASNAYNSLSKTVTLGTGSYEFYINWKLGSEKYDFIINDKHGGLDNTYGTVSDIVVSWLVKD